MLCLQKSRVRGQHNLSSTAWNAEPQSKTNKEMKVVVPQGWSLLPPAAKRSRCRAGSAVPGYSPIISARGLAALLQNPFFLQDPWDTAGSRVTVQATNSQQSGATIWSPSSNDFGVPVGDESWSFFQTSCAVAGNMSLNFGGNRGHFITRAESGCQNSKLFIRCQKTCHFCVDAFYPAEMFLGQGTLPAHTLSSGVS